MKTAVTRLVLAVALISGVAAAASAQEVVRRIDEPTPLDANDPLAVRSASLLKHILAGDKVAAVALLRKEADEEYAKGGTLETDVEAQVKRLSAGNYKIREFDKGFGADVVVHLANDKGEDAYVVIRYNGEKKMTGFAEARIQR